MNQFILTNLVAILCAAQISAEHDHTDKYKAGEFYEYAVEGFTKEEQVKIEARQHSKQVIKAPFKAVGKCFRGGKNLIGRMGKSIELFLSDSRSVNGKRRELKKAMADWEGQVTSYYDHDLENEGKASHCMYGLPYGAWKLLKNTLFTVGIRLPRATARTVRDFVLGTRDLVNG